MDRNRLIYLFRQYETGQLSEQENSEWLDLLTDSRQRAVINELAEDIFERPNLLKYRMEDAKAIEILEYILSQPQFTKSKTRVLWKRIAGVAAVVSLIICGSYFYESRRSEPGIEIAQNIDETMQDTNGTTLTLANGVKIQLGDVPDGEIAHEAGISIYKTSDGQIAYETNANTAGQNQINILSTGRGEIYLLTLPDQSKVWLNAESSLTYSANLAENGVRKVKLSGEAYFEVAQDKARTFVVESAGQEVTVLGTHFNINGYADEPQTKTTLLEGSVAVSSSGGMILTLKPGEQSILARSGDISVKTVDVDNAVAWKEGYFHFENENLESIMRKISKWYDVEVEYADDKLKELVFSGTVSKYKNVAQVLKKLELTNVLQFKTEQKKIIISTTINKSSATGMIELNH